MKRLIQISQIRILWRYKLLDMNKILMVGAHYDDTELGGGVQQN